LTEKRKNFLFFKKHYYSFSFHFAQILIFVHADLSTSRDFHQGKCHVSPRAPFGLGHILAEFSQQIKFGAHAGTPADADGFGLQLYAMVR
jgi:hypothetical protein